jgi:hypothetical protein
MVHSDPTVPPLGRAPNNLWSGTKGNRQRERPSLPLVMEALAGFVRAPAVGAWSSGNNGNDCCLCNVIISPEAFLVRVRVNGVRQQVEVR